MPIEILYQDPSVLVCIKPAGVLSTDEPGGLPELVRETLGDPNATVRTVHRLDRVVSGVMVLARSRSAASELSRQVRDREFDKEYLAVLHGAPQRDADRLTDLLLRSKEERKTYVVTQPGKDVQEAALTYCVTGKAEDLTRVRIHLETGRTHQIRAQFSSRGLPLVGDRKYSLLEDNCPIALWSHCISFTHPKTKEKMTFRADPPEIRPWNAFPRESAR